MPNLQWWASAANSTLAANPDGTGAVVVGGPVGFVSDLSGKGNDLVMGNSVLAGGDANRPTFQANNYLKTPGISFDGINEILSLRSPIANGATEFTLAMVIGGPPTPGGSGTVWWGSYAPNGGAALINLKPNSQNAYFAAASGGSLSTYGNANYGLSTNDSETIIIVRMKEGGPIEYWQNGLLGGTGSWATGTNNAILAPQRQLIGGYNTASNSSSVVPAASQFSKGSFLEGVATNSYLSDTQLSDLTQYLTQKWPAIQHTGGSPNIYDPAGSHVQGVAVTPTQRFVFHTGTITTFDSNWNAQGTFTNPNVYAGLPSTYGAVAHMGDGAYANGKLFAPLEVGFSGSGRYIGVYDATKPGLPLLGYRDVSAQGHEVSSITIAPNLGAHGIMFMTSFFAGQGADKLWMYDYEGGDITSSHFGDFLGSANIPANITGIQGVTYHNGFFYFSEDSSNIDRVRWLGSTLDATSEHVYKGVTTVQGIASDDNALYLTYQSGSTTEYVVTLTTGQLSTLSLPEPSTNGMMLCGAALLLLFVAWRKRSASRMLRKAA